MNRLFGADEPSAGQVRMFSLLLPLADAVERSGLPGLNLVAVARKAQAAGG